MRRVLAASLIVLGAGLAAVAAGALLPTQAALAISIAVVLGVPGWALLHVCGITQRLDVVACLGLLPAAALIVWGPWLAFGMVAGLPFAAVTALVAASSIAGLTPARRRMDAPPRDLAIAAVGAAVGFALGTRWQWSFYGDELFHAGRIQKLLALDRLSLDGVSTYLNGDPHAGYAFPLLHAVQAGAIDLVRADPAAAYPDLSPAFAMLLPIVLFATGRAIGGTAVGVSSMALGLFDAVEVSPPALGMLQWPGPFVFFLLTPIALLVVVEAVRSQRDPWLEAMVAAVAACAVFVHPTYIVMMLAMLAGVCLLTRRGWRALAAATGTSAVILAWLWFVALRGAHLRPPASGQWRIATPIDYVIVAGHAIASTAADIVQGRIPFLLAALALPVLLVWRDRRYALAATAMAGPVLVVGLPGPVAAGIATIGVGQTHRLPEAIPWVFTLATALAVVVADLRPRLAAAWVLPAAVAALALVGISQIWRQPDWSWLPMTPVALVVAGITVVYIARGWRAGTEAPPAPVGATLVLTLLVLAVPVAHEARGLAHDLHRGVTAPPSSTVPAGLAARLRPVAADGHLPVVLATPSLAYQLVGFAPVYAVAVPEVRSRAEPKNDPAVRRAAVRRFLDPATAEAVRRSIAARYDVRYVIAESLGRKGSELVRQLSRDPGFRRVNAFRRTPGTLFTLFERV